ncbi:DUF1642 domain-containing protein [Enterococcus durans]|uniref:DUF1642 domain-containing protein n=1 Tax=Enterococcus durans TaxID=53345 RepID=A0A5N0YK16_9ENTE|nr:DUF1642 domain-containing protein [Enterococcus durans]KAA9183937.1 DUF1642 domain-containing protein [Enterococcus durans]KAA9185184.1 DUF1642 domain-containing protein [Enterococcus durans]KAA9188230.1 DUF1642 domain-containing protein [Enterococcus durans]KAA9189383.1 DUF1642 domain-containing protein [Enterococcus durans]KAA9190271.1 DUF1642 domain-containing protein [Enterococcus durans]
MNKQELIDKYTTERDKLRPYCPNRNQSEEKLKLGIFTEFIADLKQLDEPQKPVVPKFLDEYIKDNEGQHAADIFSAEWLYEESGVLEEKVAEWLLDDEVEENNRRYLIAVQAFVTGDYEVEKEPLYRVKIGEGYFVEYQGRGALIMPDCNKEIKIFDSKSDAERTAQTIGGTVEEVAEE